MCGRPSCACILLFRTVACPGNINKAQLCTAPLLTGQTHAESWALGLPTGAVPDIWLSTLQGSVLASDAFFPFSWNDSVEKACQAGVAAIAHPGGSLRDQDAIDCCNKYGVALVTTGVRHFRH